MNVWAVISSINYIIIESITAPPELVWKITYLPDTELISEAAHKNRLAPLYGELLTIS